MAESLRDEAKLNPKDRRVLLDVLMPRMKILGGRLLHLKHIDESVLTEMYECLIGGSFIINKPIPTGLNLVYKKGIPAHYRDNQGHIYGDDKDFSSIE